MMDRQTDICYSKVAFATENEIVVMSCMQSNDNVQVKYID